MFALQTLQANLVTTILCVVRLSHLDKCVTDTLDNLHCDNFSIRFLLSQTKYQRNNIVYLSSIYISKAISIIFKQIIMFAKLYKMKEPLDGLTFKDRSFLSENNVQPLDCTMRNVQPIDCGMKDIQPIDYRKKDFSKDQMVLAEPTCSPLVCGEEEQLVEKHTVIKRILMRKNIKSTFDKSMPLLPIKFPKKIPKGYTNKEPKQRIIDEALASLKLVEILYSKYQNSRLNFKCVVETHDKKQDERWLDILITSRLEPHAKYVDYISSLYLYHSRIHKGMLKRAIRWDKCTNSDLLVPLVKADKIVPDYIREAKNEAYKEHRRYKLAKHRQSLKNMGL